MQTVNCVETNANLNINVEDIESNEKELSRKLLRLPLARVKHIIKLDMENGKMSKDSVFLIAKATELFLEYLGKESAKYALQSKKKTVQKRDINAVIDSVPQLCFLEGALE